MRAQATAFLALAAATAGMAGALAGCGSAGSARPSAASTPAATRQAGRPRPGHPSRSSQAPAAQTAARKSPPPARSAPPTTPPTRAPAPASHGPAPRRSVVKLTRGLYTDSPDGTPHYVLAFTSPAGSTLRGSASFLYQDGRVSSAGSYAGSLSASGKLTLTLGDGKVLSGRYADGRISLTDCTVAFPLARFGGGCSFIYHGHTP